MLKLKNGVFLQSKGVLVKMFKGLRPLILHPNSGSG